MNKYCRICWNTKDWRQPTGEAKNIETGDSYVLEHGFGHEEWLFNFSCLLSGFQGAGDVSYKYGFLQPIGKFYEKYRENSFSVLLYTRTPEGRYLIVARIDNLFVPSEEELGWALYEMNNNGSLAAMQGELEQLGIDSHPLRNPSPLEISNVRFSPEDVTFSDPRPIVTGNHKILRLSRYHPLNWDDDFSPNSYSPAPISPPISPDEDDDPTRSESERTRAAIESTAYDPYHIKLQNSLYRKLVSIYGSNNVKYEKGFVDITLYENGRTTFIEVKACSTVKRCVREALGQLLEYSHYPNTERADLFWVVGDAVPRDEDIIYMEYLRNNYQISIYYRRWNWASNDLKSPI